MIAQVSANSRYLLWRRGLPRSDWAAWLGRHTSMAPSRIPLLLSGNLTDDQISEAELVTLSRALDLPEDEGTLRYSDLPAEGSNVLRENLQHLFHSLGHGGKKELARRLGIASSTVSRWLNGANEPHAATLATVVTFFGLPPETDLRLVPIFLSLDPVSSTEKRRWLHARVDAMSPDDLRELFPALRRILDKS